jgi:hypothetical protein
LRHVVRLQQDLPEIGRPAVLLLEVQVGREDELRVFRRIVVNVDARGDLAREGDVVDVDDQLLAPGFEEISQRVDDASMVLISEK